MRMDDVRKALKRAIEESGMDLKEVSVALGKNHAYMQQFINREIPRKLKEEDRIKLAEILSVDESELGGPVRSAQMKVGDGAQITLFDIRAGMGGGGLLEVETYEDGRPHESSVAGYFGLPGVVSAGLRQPEKVHALPVTGDSMEPTLLGGSYVFVDTTHTNPSPADIYAIDYGDGLLVKRVELIPQSSKVLIISDNERYSDYEMERETVHVYGRVIAWFQWR